MKRILDILDYVFYRMYLFVLAHRFINGDKDDKRVSTIAIYFLMLIIPIILFVLVPILQVNGLKVPRRYTLERYIWLAVGLLLMYPFYKRYNNPKNLQKYEERWGNEDYTLKKKRGWLIWLLVITNFILLPLLVIFLQHNHIFITDFIKMMMTP